MNEYISAERTNRYIAAKMKKADMALVMYSIGRGQPIKPPVRIEYYFFEPNRRRDKDNVAGWAHKVIQDALIKKRVIKNDGWADVDSWEDRFVVDNKNPRIEVKVYHTGETHT